LDIAEPPLAQLLPEHEREFSPRPSTGGGAVLEARRRCCGGSLFARSGCAGVRDPLVLRFLRSGLSHSRASSRVGGRRSLNRLASNAAQSSAVTRDWLDGGGGGDYGRLWSSNSTLCAPFTSTDTVWVSVVGRAGGTSFWICRRSWRRGTASGRSWGFRSAALVAADGASCRWSGIARGAIRSPP